MRHQGPIAGIAAHGDWIATAGYDNRVILWRASTREAVGRGLHDHLVNNCSFNHDGSLLVTASSDYSARIWDVPGMRLRAVLAGHGDDVDMAAFSPDGRRVATCALDRLVRVFDLEGRCLHAMPGHSGNILSVTWSPDGRRLISSSVDGTVREWDAAEGRELAVHDIDGVRTDSLVILSDGSIVAGDDDGRIVIVRGGAIRYHPAHRAGIKKVVFDEASGLLVTLSYDRSIALWQGLRPGAGMPREVARSELPVTVWARAATALGDGRIAVGTFGATYGIFDPRDGGWDMDGVAAGPALNAVAVRDDTVYAIGDAGVLHENGRPRAEMGSLCNFLQFAGNHLYTGGQLGIVFDAHTGRALHQHSSPLNCAASFERDGVRMLAVGSYTGEVLLFEVDAAGALHLRHQIAVDDSAIKGLSAAQGRLFAVCASTLVAWYDLRDGSALRRIPKAHTRIANACCPVADGGFASVGRDRVLRLWLDGEEASYPSPHPNSVKCLVASADGRMLMSGSYGGTVAAFDLHHRRWLPMRRPTSAGISALTYRAARQRFVASSYDGELYELSHA